MRGRNPTSTAALSKPTDFYFFQTKNRRNTTNTTDFPPKPKQQQTLLSFAGLPKVKLSIRALEKKPQGLNQRDEHSRPLSNAVLGDVSEVFEDDLCLAPSQSAESGCTLFAVFLNGYFGGVFKFPTFFVFFLDCFLFFGSNLPSLGMILGTRYPPRVWSHVPFLGKTANKIARA